jgi:hypothetical protein
MNHHTYTIGSDSRRWWWPPAAAGVCVTAVVAAIVAVPVAGQARPVEITRNEAPATVIPAPVSGTDHPCFAVRTRWNVALDGPQPSCR